jgi:hypothetical protein
LSRSTSVGTRTLRIGTVATLIVGGMIFTRVAAPPRPVPVTAPTRPPDKHIVVATPTPVGNALLEAGWDGPSASPPRSALVVYVIEGGESGNDQRQFRVGETWRDAPAYQDGSPIDFSFTVLTGLPYASRGWCRITVRGGTVDFNTDPHNHQWFMKGGIPSVRCHYDGQHVNRTEAGHP